jgi:hypothetical protein
VLSEDQAEQLVALSEGKDWVKEKDKETAKKCGLDKRTSY